MQFGITMFPTDTAIQPAELAQEVEQRGFESLWFPEHSHIPVSRDTPWPGGAELPEWYWRTHDQFVALTAAAVVTDSIKLATGITLVAQRDPIWLAKQVASLDTVSGGRVIFGVGYGWNKEEMAHHGVTYSQRRAVVREKVLAMKALWTDDIASFDGEHVQFSASWAWPKPVQRPHPPIVLGGGAGPKMFAAVAEFGDGWIPIGGRNPIIASMEDMRSAAAEAGRPEPEVSVFGSSGDESTLVRYAEAGVARVIFSVPSGPAEVVLPILDRRAALVEQLG